MKTIKNPHGPSLDSINHQRQMASQMARTEPMSDIEKNLWDNFDEILRQDIDRCKKKSQ